MNRQTSRTLTAKARTLHLLAADVRKVDAADSADLVAVAEGAAVHAAEADVAEAVVDAAAHAAAAEIAATDK